MSLEYQVCLKESISQVVKSADAVNYPIELTEVLPADEMQDLLREALKRRGFEELEGSPQQLIALGAADEQIVFDLEAMEVRVTLEAEQEIEENVEVYGQGATEKQAAQDARGQIQHSRDAAEARLEKQAEIAQQKLTRALERSEEERLRMLNEVVQEVYAESLKRKAGQLGQVIDIQEGTNDGRYELTIKVAR